jgi:hypothetical protein
MASLKFYINMCTILALAFIASPVLGKTVTASIKDKKVTFSGFGGDRKYAVRRKIQKSFSISQLPVAI